MDTQIKDSINIRATSRVSFLDVNDRKFGALELFVNGELSQVIIVQLAQPIPTGYTLTNPSPSPTGYYTASFTGAGQGTCGNNFGLRMRTTFWRHFFHSRSLSRAGYTLMVGL